MITQQQLFENYFKPGLCNKSGAELNYETWLTCYNENCVYETIEPDILPKHDDVYINNKNGFKYMVDKILPDCTNNRVNAFSVVYFGYDNACGEVTRELTEFLNKFTFFKNIPMPEITKENSPELYKLIMEAKKDIKNGKAELLP